jgi:hypothetical protein
MANADINLIEGPVDHPAVQGKALEWPGLSLDLFSVPATEIA